MRYWEFLIQQEGDQTWLPLETRQVEILEGRYRMAAYTSYDDTPVEVRVSQLLLEEMPPRRRVRKRKSMTNDSGLLAIFPFMQLNPGRWEIDCNSPDVIDDFLGEAWHYSVQLQVTPRDEDDWEPDWSDAATEEDLSQSMAGTAEAATDVYLSGSGGSGSGVSGSANIDPANLDPAAAGAAQLADVKLELKQQAYVTQLGQSLTLMGQLFTANPGDNLASCQLWVQLRDPQTANSLQEKAVDLSPQKLPAPFSVTITLPDELSTQVILGAISLRDREGSADRPAWASASFTVTIGLAQMLDAIANQPNLEFEEEISIFPGSTESFVPHAKQAETLLTYENPIVPRELIPSEGLTLPPQLTPPNPNDVDRPPELPTFPTSSRTSQEPMGSPTAPKAVEHEDETLDSAGDISGDMGDNQLPDQAINQAPSDGLAPNQGAEEMTALDENIRLETARPTVDEPLAFAEPRVFDLGNWIEEDDLDLELAAAAAAEDLPPNPPLGERPFTTSTLDDADISDDLELADTAEDTQWNPTAINIERAFQKLQLRERFWQKLNLLTQDGYRQSVEVKRALQPSDTWPEGNPQSNEFVVYEQQPQYYPPEPPSGQPPRRDQGKSDDAAPLQVLPPILDVPMQELVAGEWIAIRVRMPMTDYQPYVKVWMNDLQTRTVIEAPRLLMQFTPNDLNELETLMRVQVPSGCLELQIAAIAVDMTTLQESRKVVQNRRVMPPDDSLSVFDEW
ncbi:hypothetical protein [Leptothoe sp. PORK10 BA2]|uniref:hypothetical protein n=1 Tax=Leptothoe sp. PORK10 BA2 TaxID=3110254 RepID=UPI002B208FF1|nr:hypothetical protein [Leptothoe sp. PORK10 BA2]MEA5465903.1 hypothetical protein [Leptothoe sp. PORK10 BA2]